MALAAAPPPGPVPTGRCGRALPLDAGQGFDRQRFLLVEDRLYRFDPAPEGLRWRLRERLALGEPAVTGGLFRTRRKWRDGALWTRVDRRIYRRDPERGTWELRAEPALEFMDFEVDMTGRILLVCTADPRTRSYRGLLEAVGSDGRGTELLAPYPDPGCVEWGRRVPPVAAATLQAGYESVQVLECVVLFNPLARRAFVFQPLRDQLKEIKLDAPRRGYPDLAEGAAAIRDVCWQVLPKDATEAWIVMNHPGPGLRAVPVDLFEAEAGAPVDLPGLKLPLFPGPDGRLMELEAALAAYSTAAQTRPRPSRDGT